MSKMVRVTFSDDQQTCIMLPENVKSHAEIHEWLRSHLIGVVDWNDAYIEVTEGLDLGRGKIYTLNIKTR